MKIVEFDIRLIRGNSILVRKRNWGYEFQIFMIIMLLWYLDKEHEAEWIVKVYKETNKEREEWRALV
jgi:hypothetical protein